jgi:hypothetical protein
MIRKNKSTTSSAKGMPSKQFYGSPNLLYLRLYANRAFLNSISSKSGYSAEVKYNLE